jgi:uncharacterized protein YodC (DUF2158 family)
MFDSLIVSDSLYSLTPHTKGTGATVAFQKGDIVIVKSGGPRMTVAELVTEGTYTGYIRCVWFEGKKQQGGYFDEVVLVKDETPPPGSFESVPIKR